MSTRLRIPIESLSLNRNSKIPLHQQLYDILRAQLDGKAYTAGEKFFTESDLTESFNISRNTARQVLTRLSEENYIIRERGRGTIVAEPGLEQSLEKIVSFTEEMTRRGLKPGTVVLGQEIVKPSEIHVQTLRITPQTDLVRIKRLRLGDGLPICIEESYLVKAYFPNIDQYDFSKFPLRVAIETTLNSRMNYAHQKIKAIAAPDHLTEILEIPPQAPILFIERVTYTDHLPVEYLKIYYRGDRFTLYNELLG